LEQARSNLHPLFHVERHLQLVDMAIRSWHAVSSFM
jgi:hypothetical protein